MTTLDSYLEAVAAQGSHVGKVHQFLSYLEAVFKLAQTDYELELMVKSSRLQVRGKIDTVIGDVIFEVKTNLVKELIDAQAQLRRYLSVFEERYPGRPCIGMATDGVVFFVYRPLFNKINTGECELEETERQDLRKLSDQEAILWLDRYLFRRAPKEPTEEDILARFGASSPTCRLALAQLKEWWRQVEHEASTALKFELWQKQLTIVYGEGLGSEALFLKHTYLATVAKLLAAVAFRRPVGDVSDVLVGTHFLNVQIHNFVEEDLFFWPMHPKVRHEATVLAERLLGQLREYDPKGFNEDILKGLYQGLVDPEVRHELGEYYTPDWLAESMLRHVIDGNPTIRMIDPACGSGTFLFLGIRLISERLKSAGWPKEKILRHIEQNVFGIDVHPLAVLISRTNYLLACAPLLGARKGAFNIPVYLGDSLMYRTVAGTMDIPDVEIRVGDDLSLWFPDELTHDPALLDEVVRTMAHWADQGSTGGAGFDAFLRGADITPAGRNGLRKTFRTMRALVESDRDSIWGYVVRNLARPYVLSRGERFDLVIGNPPWLAQRYIKSAEYQGFVKTRMASFGIKPKGGHLVTHLDLSALFFAECSFRYLRIGGTIAFVMPRGALRGRQYREFTKFQFGGFTFVAGTEFWDLKDVKPLFKVPACVLICKREAAPNQAVPLRIISGKLPRKNASWQQACDVLTVQADTWVREKSLMKPSEYHSQFRQGATLVPQCFWFVRFDSDPMLGVNPKAPVARTDVQPDAKKPWNDIELKGQGEADFLWGCILPEDMLPFAARGMRLVIVPGKIRESGAIDLLDAQAAMQRGYQYLGAWLAEAEEIWKDRKTAAAPAKLNDWIDWRGKLSAQFPPHGRYLVLYTKSATHLTACVAEGAICRLFRLASNKCRRVGSSSTTPRTGTQPTMKTKLRIWWLG